MKKYEFLLFDADGTLLDYSACEARAISLTMRRFGLEPDSGKIAAYSQLNRRYWDMIDSREIARAEALERRFVEFFALYGVECSGREAEDFYRERLAEGGMLLDGAAGLIGALHGRYRMFIITNGVMRSQTRRIKNSGLWEFFERVFISEETGSQKPQPEFMDYAAARIPGFDPAAALIIGDSPTTDMALGRSCGIDTCFFDPEGRGFAPEAGFRPTYTVRSHAEIEELLK